MKDQEEQTGILKAVVAEQIANRDLEIKVILTPALTFAIIAMLQLASRHPGASGESAAMVQEFVIGTIEHLRRLGLTATAAAAELGNDPANDRAV